MPVSDPVLKPAATSGILWLALLCSACSTLPDSAEAIVTDERLHLLARNPWAARQRTTNGQRIQSVEYSDGQVYVGYGDWRANTGPIAVSSWDIERGEWLHHFRAETEAIERIRSLDSGLFIPYTDPERGADYARGPQWREEKALNRLRESFYHAFDAAETDDGIYLVGTRYNTGEPQVLHWDGAQWQESLVLPGKQDWLWFAAVLDGQLVVQTEQQGTYRLVNKRWQQRPALFSNPRTRAVVSAGPRVAGISRENAYVGRLQTSDGKQYHQETEPDALDLNVDQASGWIYLLRRDRIERSRDLLSWETLDVPVPAGASALDVAEGMAWIGTASSNLWAVELPAE